MIDSYTRLIDVGDAVASKTEKLDIRKFRTVAKEPFATSRLTEYYQTLMKKLVLRGKTVNKILAVTILGEKATIKTSALGTARTMDLVGSFWVGQDSTPSKAEQAREATGRIQFPKTTLSFSPPKRTLVNLDTWFWADLPTGNLRGSEALGLVAIATPERLEIDPGDGSG